MQIVTTHKNTDFDGFASVVAATLIYPEAVAVLSKHVNPNIKAFLSIHKDLFKYCWPDEVDSDEVDRLIVVDTNAWHRLDGLADLAKKESLEILLWDHHTDDGDIEASWSCQEPMERSSDPYPHRYRIAVGLNEWGRVRCFSLLSSGSTGLP